MSTRKIQPCHTAEHGWNQPQHARSQVSGQGRPGSLLLHACVRDLGGLFPSSRRAGPSLGGRGLELIELGPCGCHLSSQLIHGFLHAQHPDGEQQPSRRHHARTVKIYILHVQLGGTIAGAVPRWLQMQPE